MVLVSTGRSRERVLVFGLEGVGKSLAALDIASRVAPHKLYVIDNDNAWDRMLEGQTLAGETVNVAEEYRWDAAVERKAGKDVGGWVFDDKWCVDGGNVVVFHADGWEANKAAIAAVREEATGDDWCCIDSGSALWSDVQAWFTEQVFDQSMDDYFMQVRMEKAKAQADAKALGALDGWVDWPVINAQYNGAVMKFLVNPPCHLIVTAEQADVTSDQVDKETRAMYGGEMVKPRGQKRIGHNVQTVLRMVKRGEDYKVTTVKDRGGRDKFKNDDVTDRGFAEWYLEEIAGWQEQTESTPTTPPTGSTTATGSTPTSRHSGLVSKKPVAKTKTTIVKKG